MELQSISQVSKAYDISARMLRYYEQIGLINSIREENNSYRHYDEGTLKRIQQIIVLRKLQIPVKQIKDILSNQNAVTVIEIFEQNISGLDEKITALSSLKSILMRFVEEMKEKADIQLKLDILNDETILAAVSSLSFSENKIEEKVSMEELNKTAEQMNKITENEVRIVYLPPSIVAQAYDPDDNPDLRDNPYEGGTKSIMQKFIDDVDLFKIKPDARIYAWGDTMNGKRVEMMWATIPNDIEVPAPLTKEKFDGGLYAMTSSYTANVGEWVDKSGKYEWNRIRRHNQHMEELINPISFFDVKNMDSKTTGATYVDNLLPLLEIRQWTDDSISDELAKLDKLFANGKTTEVDLKTMEKQNDFELKFSGGLIIHEEMGALNTPQKFNVPLKIKLRAKTDSTDIIIRYGKGCIGFQHFNLRDKLMVADIAKGNDHFHSALKEIPANEFVDIEIIISKEIMVIKVDDELWRIGDDYGYIEEFKENPDFGISSAISIITHGGATVTVERLCITEI